jgi:hypothetical protein
MPSRTENKDDRYIDKEWLRDELIKLLTKAEDDYQDAAALHSMAKVSMMGGRIDAYREILKLH